MAEGNSSYDEVEVADSLCSYRGMAEEFTVLSAGFRFQFQDLQLRHQSLNLVQFLRWIPRCVRARIEFTKVNNCRRDSATPLGFLPQAVESFLILPHQRNLDRCV